MSKAAKFMGINEDTKSDAFYKKFKELADLAEQTIAVSKELEILHGKNQYLTTLSGPSNVIKHCETILKEYDYFVKNRTKMDSTRG